MHEGKGATGTRPTQEFVSRCERRKNFLIGMQYWGGGGGGGGVDLGPPPQSFKGSYSTVNVSLLWLCFKFSQFQLTCAQLSGKVEPYLW